jgi:hypothetical protein
MMRIGRAARAVMRRERGEDGVSLVEVAIAVSMTAVVLTMTTIMVTTISDQTTAAVRLGQSTEGALTGLSTISSYLASITSPSAAVATGGVAGQQINGSQITLSSSGPCWGESDPYTTAMQNTGVYPTDPASVNNGATNAATAIIAAHDYAIEFCGYVPGSNVTHVLEIYLDTSTCLNATNGYCTVKVVDYGTSGYTGTSSGDYLNPSAGTVIQTINNVWCDAACRATAPNPSPSTGNTGTDNAGGDGAACSSYNTWGGTQPTYLGNTVSCTGAGTPANATNSNQPNQLTYTPPLFTYYSSSGAGVSTPLQTVNPTFDYYNSNVYQYLQTISSIKVQLTVLSNKNPATPITQGHPGSQATQQIWLPQSA